MTIDVFSYASDIGGNEVGTADGPHALQTSHLLNTALPWEWHPALRPLHQVRGKEALLEIERLSKELATATKASVLQKHPVLTLGGDHSSAIGTWSGIATALQAQGPIGLIWVDAHMDSHTHETTLSHNIHGMPLASLLGHGLPQLTHIASPLPKLLPQHVALIGIRSFEAGEAELLHRLKVRVYKMEEVQQRGLEVVVREALQQVTRETVGFGISIDVDGIDPLDAPGVTVPEPNGIAGQDLLNVLPLVKNTPHFLGAEIVEFNPHHDQERKTLKLAAQIINTLFQ